MSASKTTILVADDDPQLLRLVTRSLELEDFEVLPARDGEEALTLFQTQKPDLLLLDVMMPKLNGFSVCQRVRTFSAIPIILLTARGLEHERVHGLDLGADDYVSKPFDMQELLSRVRAVLRRSRSTARTDAAAFFSSISFGDLKLDFMAHQVSRAGQPISLSPTEFRLLQYLAQNADLMVPQDDLLEAVWGAEYIGKTHLLQVTINRLRNKLEADPAHPRYILKKPGVGYFLAAHPVFDESE